jgi:hypothetical protein
VRRLEKDIANSLQLKRDLYHLGDDDWNQVVCISRGLSHKSYCVEEGFLAHCLG